MEEREVRINEKKKEVIIKNINKNRGSYKEKNIVERLRRSYEETF